MRRLVVAASLAGAVVLATGTSHSASIPVGGPNPNWTDDQKFEWYLGRMATAAQMCGAYTEAGVLHRLARMSPYGNIGLSQMRGDDFYGPACVEISADAKELAADADDIEAYLEATYRCEGDGCFGQSLLDDWQTHACSEALKSHLASRAIENEHVEEVSIHSVRLMSAVLEHQARVRFSDCQGSFYVEMKESCSIKRDYTRGDCEVPGVDRY